MKSSIKNNSMPSLLQLNNFHQALGHLFYAIAAADKTIRPKEIEALTQLIQSEWLPTENVTADVAQIQTNFNHLIDQGTEAQEAMATFKLFKETHNNLFTNEVKQQIWKTVNTIAESVSGKNKSELVMLSKLSVLFKN